VEPIDVGDLGRIRDIARVLSRHGFRQLRDQLGSSPPPDPSENTAPWARRLRDALVELGPSFVKLGQVLSLRPDLLPHDAIVELQTLQDRVPPMPADQLDAVLAAELRRPLDTVFAQVDRTPIGSASVAQVHRAQLLDGTWVALKVQREGIEPTIHSDLKLLHSLAELVEGRITLPGVRSPSVLVREFEVAIRRELDFLQEARAAQRLGRALRDHPVRVPKIFHELTTRRLLVMELVSGQALPVAMVHMSESERQAVAHALMDATWLQIFEHGLFHGDPHPGNLWIDDEGRLTLLDFGVTGLLTASMQKTILRVFTALVFRDPDMLAQTIYQAGATHGRIDLIAFRNALERKMVEYYGATLAELNRKDTLVEVVEMATEFRIDLPPEFALLARALNLIEGNVRALLPEVDIVEELRPYAERLLRQQVAPDRLLQQASSVLLQLQGQFSDLPTRASQLMQDLDHGRVSIRAADPGTPLLATAVRDAGQLLALGLAAIAAAVLSGVAPKGVAGPAGVLSVLLILGVLIHPVARRALSPRYWAKRVMRVARFFRRTGPGRGA